MLTITNCPKCGQKLADGATRCSATGCDYVLPAGAKGGAASDLLSQMLGNAIGTIKAAQAARIPKPLPESGVCDCCNGTIPKGEGYSFFSSASGAIPGMQQLVGNMMLCENCTNKIITADNWTKPIPQQRELTGADILANPMALHDTLNAANADSIVQNCKSHGFSPEQAKEKARSFAQRWWNAPEATQIESAKFWTEQRAAPSPTLSSRRKGYLGCLIVFGVVAVVLIGFCVFSVVMSQREFQHEELLAKEAANRFLKLIAEDKLPDAYRSMSRDFRANQKMEDLSVLIKELRLLEETTTTWGNFKYRFTRECNLQGFVETKDSQVIAFSMSLKREDGEWRVLSLARSQKK